MFVCVLVCVCVACCCCHWGKQGQSTHKTQTHIASMTRVSLLFDVVCCLFVVCLCCLVAVCVFVVCVVCVLLCFGMFCLCLCFVCAAGVVRVLLLPMLLWILLSGGQTKNN